MAARNWNNNREENMTDRNRIQQTVAREMHKGSIKATGIRRWKHQEQYKKQIAEEINKRPSHKLYFRSDDNKGKSNA
jgi:hypothetical protein